MKKTTIVHIILITAIIVIAGVSAYRLYRWNKGAVTVTPVTQQTPEPVDPEAFDTEVLDMIIPMDSTRMNGHEDDGELQILCLGNNPFSDDRSSTGLASLIAQKTGGTVYDATFPDSSTAYKYNPINPNYPMDHFSLPSIGCGLMGNDFYTLNAAVPYMNDPENFQKGLDALEAVDMSTLDVMVIMYDSTDYNNGTPCVNEQVEDDVMAFTGGLKFFMNIVKQYWPYVRVYVLTPTYAQYMDENGKMYSGSLKDIGNGTLPYYVQNEIDTTVGAGNSLIDNYYGTINENNYEEYMSDYMHLNEKGREKVAERVSKIIMSNMSVVQSAPAE